MITPESVKAEVDKVPLERLDELYRVVKKFTEVEHASSGKSLMARLREIEIEGPEDFAEQVDCYLNGEKAVE